MKLSTFFAEELAGASAFPGSVDSVLLVWAAVREGVTAQCGLPMTVLKIDKVLTQFIST